MNLINETEYRMEVSNALEGFEFDLSKAKLATWAQQALQREGLVTHHCVGGYEIDPLSSI